MPSAFVSALADAVSDGDDVFQRLVQLPARAVAWADVDVRFPFEVLLLGSVAAKDWSRRAPARIVTTAV